LWLVSIRVGDIRERLSGNAQRKRCLTVIGRRGARSDCYGVTGLVAVRRERREQLCDQLTAGSDYLVLSKLFVNDAAAGIGKPQVICHASSIHASYSLRVTAPLEEQLECGDLSPAFGVGVAVTNPKAAQVAALKAPSKD
jgi:hypothetical protein